VVAPKRRALHLAMPGMVAHKRDLRRTRQGIVAVAVVSAKQGTTRRFSLDKRCLCPGARRDHWPHFALTLMEASIKLSARAEWHAPHVATEREWQS
jgi:hypothetical protein